MTPDAGGDDRGSGKRSHDVGRVGRIEAVGPHGVAGPAQGRGARLVFNPSGHRSCFKPDDMETLNPQRRQWPPEYRLDPTQSRFTVQAFATGLLSMLGHNPTFAARDFRGEMRFSGAELDGMLLELHRRHQLHRPHRPASRPATAAEIMDRMRLRRPRNRGSPAEITFRTGRSPAEPVSPRPFPGPGRRPSLAARRDVGRTRSSGNCRSSPTASGSAGESVAEDVGLPDQAGLGPSAARSSWWTRVQLVFDIVGLPEGQP